MQRLEIQKGSWEQESQRILTGYPKSANVIYD